MTCAAVAIAASCADVVPVECLVVVPIIAEVTLHSGPGPLVSALSTLTLLFVVANPAQGFSGGEQSDSPAMIEVSSPLAIGERIAQRDADASWILVRRITYTVAPGDTLFGIALRYDISTADIRRWNRMTSDTIVVGQELTLHVSGGHGDRRRIEHEVSSGDTGLGIALEYDVTLDQLRRWNPSLNPDRLRIGQEIVIYVESGGGGSERAGEPGAPRAVGEPNNGRLIGGTQLETGVGYFVRNPGEAWGMPETLGALRDTHARLATSLRDDSRAVVADISRERGGRFPPHASHQNGLDADVAYYTHDCQGERCRLRSIGADELDVVRQWYVFEDWLLRGAVEYIFVDYELQQPLYEYAQARGASDEQLSEWFQYPRAANVPRGIIRHSRGHDDHYHVRFRRAD